MKIINVLDHEIKVYIEDPKIWSIHMGMCDISNGEIRLNINNSIDIMQSTFLHELLHIILDLNSIKLSEESIDGISLGLNSYLKNNHKNILEIKDEPE